MDSICVIPARGNSKRVPGKNLKWIAGKPMVLWVMLAALESEMFRTIILDSEDPEILDLAFQGITPHMRGPELSRDEVNQWQPVIAVALGHLLATDHYDALCMLTACVPTTPAELIRATGEEFERTRPDMLRTIRLAEHPHHLTEPITEGHPELGLRNFTSGGLGKQTPELPPVYIPSGNLVWTDFDVVASASPKLVLGGYSIHNYGYIVPHEWAIDIDTPFDFKIAEFLLNQRRDSTTGPPAGLGASWLAQSHSRIRNPTSERRAGILES